MAVFWKTGYYKADPEQAYKEIMSLEEITAQNVVNMAKSEESSIHNEFEWDDAIAGNKWRCQQARVLMDNLVIEYESRERDEEPVLIKVLHTTPDRKDYKPIEFFITHEDEYQKLLNCAIREVKAYQNKYRTISELHGLFAEIDKL